MQKEEQSSRQIVKSHIMTIMGVDNLKATQLVNEMEQLGLIRFDEFGNVGILVLEGQS
ncbi:hypothetical protein B8V67_01965 [Streptococcus agalactiae]|uniref:hypothetical protein n=1 Tax=Streptococcus agalactiae TaxID=1311 RepID=UPI00192A2A1D|nr:hypothetical protein [Streptococcus agalactiae]KAF1240159.1 hypothetical protein B8V67_01965 [Streptococcus agalactiae]